MVPCRYYTVILLFFMWILPLNAQDSLLYNKVSFRDTICTVETALKIIEHQTNLSFSYNTGLISKKKIISFGADNEPLVNLLSQIFNDATLSFSIIGKHLVVYKSIKTRAVNPESKTDSTFYFEISGRVFDINSQEALPFTSVYLFGKSIGIISNEEGRFLLKLSSASITETLCISCMGYLNFTAPVSSLINTTKDYFLRPDVISIQEVIIRKLSPVVLLQTANNRIRNNYPQKPAILTSFYRETIQRGNNYMMVSEALLENYKSSYTGISSDQVKILKGRKNEELSRRDSVMLRLKAGLNTTLLLDVVKNMPDFMTGENLQDYNYKLADMVVEDGKENYAIEFSPKEESLNALFSGRIILGIDDLAFKSVEFYIGPERLSRATDLFIIRKPAKLIVKMLKANYKVAFRKSGNKYYLQLIQCETGFKIRYRRQLSGSVYNTRLEMAVTDIDTTHVGRFPSKQTARLREFFADQVGAYDEAFWGEYNYITPGESLENALIRLSKSEAVKREEE
jgi:hypothetical protein